jgi:diaminobutyrate acetyltransferase
VTGQCGTQPEINVASARNIRTPELADAAAIWRLVEQSETLETNSCYAYLLLCRDFADTCLVAYDGDRLAGFVAAYTPPSRPNVVFVWQIGVDSRDRGRGLGRQLLTRLVDDAVTRGVQYMEATVTADNRASLGLFRSFASRGGWPLTESGHFEPRHFADPQHDAELLIRIGPFKE